MDNLKMLWHSCFYDIPLDGLAEFNGEKVYFVNIRGTLITSIDNVSTLDDIIENIQNDQSFDDEKYKNKLLSELKTLEDLKNPKTKNFEIVYITTTRCALIYERAKYKIFRLPKDVLEQYEKNHQEFRDCVGYHSEHDPSMFQKYDLSKSDSTYWTKKREPIPGWDFENFTCLGTFYAEDFKWFHRPK